MPAVEIRVPGDKSIAHRALILGALAEGESVIDEVPAGQDVRSTESCLQDLGVDIVLESTGIFTGRDAHGVSCWSASTTPKRTNLAGADARPMMLLTTHTAPPERYVSPGRHHFWARELAASLEGGSNGTLTQQETFESVRTILRMQAAAERIEPDSPSSKG